MVSTCSETAVSLFSKAADCLFHQPDILEMHMKHSEKKKNQYIGMTPSTILSKQINILFKPYFRLTIFYL